jgi:gluconolactonase
MHWKRYPAKDEMFFCQNAGAKAAGTGLSTSAIIQKISLSSISPYIANLRNASGSIRVDTVNSTPVVINPNGGCWTRFGCCCLDCALTSKNPGATNYKGQLLFLGEGQGDNIAPAMYLVNPEPPYNTTSET